MPAARAIQDRLTDWYELDLVVDVAEVVFSDPERAHALCAPHGRPAHEQLFLCEREDVLELALYLAPHVLAALERAPAALDDLHALSQALEGISHFVCAAWHAQHDRPISPLELELQAEIDKYLLLRALLAERGHADGIELHRVLFERIAYAPDLSPAELERYRHANYFAARYCRALERRWGADLEHPELQRELKRFYRLSPAAKLARVRGALR